MSGKAQRDHWVAMRCNDVRQTTLDSRVAKFVCPMGVDNVAAGFVHGLHQGLPLAAEEIQHLPTGSALRTDIRLHPVSHEMLRPADLSGKRKDYDLMASGM